MTSIFRRHLRKKVDEARKVLIEKGICAVDGSGDEKVEGLLNTASIIADSTRKDSCWVVLFSDGCYQIWWNKPSKKDFQEGTELFEVDGDKEVWRIAEWMAKGYTELEDIKKIDW